MFLSKHSKHEGSHGFSTTLHKTCPGFTLVMVHSIAGTAHISAHSTIAITTCNTIYDSGANQVSKLVNLLYKCRLLQILRKDMLMSL